MIPQHFQRHLLKSDDTDIFVKYILKPIIEFYKYLMREVLQK